MGVTGHLATIGSAAENGFLFSSVLESSAFDTGAWIGLNDNEAFAGFESFGQPDPMVGG